jgi:hypothetical protein
MVEKELRRVGEQNGYMVEYLLGQKGTGEKMIEEGNGGYDNYTDADVEALSKEDDEEEWMGLD